MSAGAADVLSDPHPPKGPPAPSATHSVWAAILAISCAIGQACVWFFNLLQNSNALYSLKTFCAAMLALYISFQLDLSQPGWSMMTVYIVSQPLAGMVLSKSLARICGTLIGAVVAIIFVALFNGMQLLFIGVMAVWIGACLYVSIWLREKPGAYGAMLSGYTAAIIGFATISTPESTFDTATARCIEILLGIAIATLASRVILPRTTGRVFRYRVAGTLSDMKRCIIDTLGGHYEDTRGLLDLRKLIADSLALETIRIHASRDTPDVRESEEIVRALQGRILSVTSILVSIHDRLGLLRATRPADAAVLAPLFARVVERVELLAAPGPTVKTSSSQPSLTGELFAHLSDFETLRKEPGRTLEYSILSRLIDLLAQWQEINRLNHLLVTGGTLEAAHIPVPPAEDSRIAHYRDHSLAKIAALGAGIAVAISGSFWVITAWPNGSSAATFAGVVSCTAALQDNPARNALRTLRSCLFAATLAAVYLFGVFPFLSGFEQFALALGLSYIPLGMLMPTARFGPLAAPMLIYTASFMSLRNVLAPDLADFINSAGALMTGILIAALCFRLLRPVGLGWVVRRHTAAMMHDLADLASRDEPGSRARFETRMLDRTNAILLRLNANNPPERLRLRGTLTALRVGLNIRIVAIAQRTAPPRQTRPIRDALHALADHFNQLARRPDDLASQDLRKSGGEALQALDSAIQSVRSAEPGSPEAHPQALDTYVALSAIRATLLQHEDFYGLQGCGPRENPVSTISSSEKTTPTC